MMKTEYLPTVVVQVVMYMDKVSGEVYSVHVQYKQMNMKNE